MCKEETSQKKITDPALAHYYMSLFSLLTIAENNKSKYKEKQDELVKLKEEFSLDQTWEKALKIEQKLVLIIDTDEILPLIKRKVNDGKPYFSDKLNEHYSLEMESVSLDEAKESEKRKLLLDLVSSVRQFS